jgi:ribonucleoside-triphosphate reductase
VTRSTTSSARRPSPRSWARSRAPATDFGYLRPIWRKNCEEERLLGVSITGELDHPVLREWGSDEATEWKQVLREVVRDVNVEWAEKLHVNPSAMRTCQKPSGTVNNVVDAAPGGHARMVRQGVRRTRVHQLDPVSDVVIAAGVPHEQDNFTSEDWVLSWPIKAPEGAMVVDDLTALDQLERWLHTKRHWTEHNPSCTIQVGEDEWLSVGAWVYEHFDEIAGLSFLPRQGGHGYTQLPYEELSDEDYAALVASMPERIDWGMLAQIEIDDQTKNSRELACSAGADSCDIA